MERLYSQILGTPVVTEESMRPITSVQDLVIDPSSGQVIAFKVSRGVIVPHDIIAWQEIIKVHDFDAVIDPEDVLKVKEVLAKNASIYNMNVETEKGKLLGKVQDYSVDTNFYQLKKLYVAKCVLGLIRYDGRVINQKNVVEILPDKIVVKDDAATIKSEKVKEVGVEDMALS